MKNILMFFGTRPEFIKLVPLILEVKSYKDINIISINTGQHREMINQMISLFNIKINYSFNLMKNNQSLTDLCSDLFKSFDILKYEYDDISYSIVQGDTTTATIGSIWSYYNKIPVIHVEGGLRSDDLYNPFPEEGNRKIISSITKYHFVPTEYNKESLLKENVNSDNIFVVGNTVIDAVKYYKTLNYKPKQTIELDKKMILLTLHRRESHGKKLENICDTILELSNKYDDICFVLPVHLNPNVRDIIYDKLSNKRDIYLINPVSYFDFLYLIDKSFFIMTDSGGIQEEAPSFNKYVMVLREKTERMEAINMGCSYLVGTNRERILSVFDELYNKKGYVIENPFGDGFSSKRILDILSLKDG